MAILILGGYQGPPPSTERTHSGLLAQVVVNRAVSGLLATVSTQRLRTHSGPYASAYTFDPASVPLPPTPSRAGYVVTHTGLPAEAVSYSLSLSGDGSLKAPLPKLDVELRGRVALSGDIHISVVVQGHGEAHRQTYGPFGTIGYTHTQTPSGWVTKANTIDASEVDAGDDAPLMPIFEEEFLPWERERDLTPREQAVEAWRKALVERTLRLRTESQRRALQKQLDNPDLTPPQRRALRASLKALAKQEKPPLDLRRVPVRAVLQMALAALPLPFKLGGPLPYGGDFFWATERTRMGFLGGELIGVSYQVKDKTPLAVLTDMLSPVGWQAVTRFGVIYLGPPEELEDAAGTPGFLQLPESLLTGLSIEAVNPGAAEGNGNRQRPRRITITGASARLYLPPLPPDPPYPEDPEDPEDNPSDFGELKNGVLRSESFTYALNPDTGKEGVQSHTVTTLTKEDGLLVEETSRTEGLVPTFLLNRDQLGNYTATTLRMALQEDRRTTHVYGTIDYPRALIGSTVTVRAYLDWLQKDMPSELSNVRQEWHAEGWLRRKITSKGTYDYYTELIYQIHHEDETETWTPINDQTWHHRIRRFKSAWQIYTNEQGEPDEVRRAGVTEDWTETTDQGPPRAPQEEEEDKKGDEDEAGPDDPEQNESFPYEETLKVVVETGGRADPVTRSAPWATSIDPRWTDDVIGTIRRARTSQRTRYEMAAPPRVDIGTRIKEFSLSGSAGSVKATVTVEEALDVL